MIPFLVMAGLLAGFLVGCGLVKAVRDIQHQSELKRRQTWMGETS